MIKTVVLYLTLLFLFSGCVHDISIAPNSAELKKSRPVTIHQTVAYYIPPERYEKSVITPGGNNDTLRYTPYQDLEEGFKKVLDNVFIDVYKIDGLDDPKIKEKKIRFIFIPEIETMSYSKSIIDWEPTRFTILLKVDVLTAQKRKLFKTYAQGKGIANFGRYKDNPTYAVEIATRSALLQFQDEIITKRKRFK